MNNARIEQEADLALCQVAIQCPDAIVKTETSEEQLSQIRTGMGEDMTKLLQESKTQAICFTAEEGVKEAAPVTLSFGYQDTDRKGNRIDLYLKENSEMTVVMDYHSSEGTGTAAIQTKIHAEKNAKLKLIQIERLGEGFDCMNDIGAYCEDGAGVELVQLIIGGKKVETEKKIASVSPATKEVLGYACSCSKEQADEAIKASYEAFKKWSLTSVEERVRVLRRLAALLIENRFIILIEMQSRSNVVVSCGGGVPMRERNVAEMKKNGRVVLLTAKPETILERVKDNHDRPLLENNKNVSFIADLLEKRRAKYEAAADIVVETDGKSELEICEELIHRLREAEANK